ncbi:MAG: DUF2283 domain-containing protein [Candidatus Hydrogenedentes bacterium]|nr:DUF2283 domain-containing protein [Candidatus Hydrogenedentota bacterium]
MRMTYFEEEDVLHLIIAEGRESDSIELMPNVTAELNERGELIGVEILRASEFMRDFVLESLQAKLAGLTTPSESK